MSTTDGTWTGTAPITFAYQWLRCDPVTWVCPVIAGATSSSYTLTTADIGFKLQSSVTATNAAGQATAKSYASATITATAPANTSKPALSGTAKEGQVLSTTDGTWTGTAPITFAYQWLRCDPVTWVCPVIAGATSSSYTLTTADIGFKLQSSVTATNAAGQATAKSYASATITATAPANTSKPALSGTAKEGQVLSTTDGTWTGTAPITFAYQWLRCDPVTWVCPVIAGATSSSYTLTTADIGFKLQSSVTATNAAGQATAKSYASATITATAPPPPPPPPPPGGANLWIDTNGGTCARQATAGAYSDAQACASFDAAYAAAKIGDLVLVRAGTYAKQSVTATPKTGGSCDGYAIGAAMSGCVTIRAQTPGSVTLGDLYPAASYLRVADMTVYNVFLQPAGCTNVPSRTNIVLDNVQVHYMALGNVDHVGILGGEIGRTGVHGTVVQLADCGLGSSHRAHHIRFDGVWIHDAISDKSASQGAHLECLQGMTPVPQLTIRNSKFTNCAQWDINVAGDNLLIENNILAKTCSEQVTVGQGGNCDTGAAILTGCGSSSSNVTIRFNSMMEGVVQATGGCSYGGTNRYYGNSWYWNTPCSWLQSFNIQFDYNVSNQGSTCGSHDKVIPSIFTAPVAPGYNFHLLSCAIAAANLVPAGVPGGLPATDYAGQSRPRGAAADAGAYEDCS